MKELLSKRPVRFAIIAVASILIFFYVLLPPTAIWYIQKHSEEWTGRRISLDKISINILTGALSVEKLAVLEKDKATPFFSVEKVYVNPYFLKLIFGSYEIEEFAVDKPYIQVVQNGTQFNFDDLMDRFVSDDSTQAPTEKSEPASYLVENVSITDGVIRYEDAGLSSEIKLISISASCPKISSAEPKSRYNFNFLFDQGGTTRGMFDLDLGSFDYKLDYRLDSLNLGIFLPYVKEYVKVGGFSGLFESHQKIYGNFNTPGAVATTGDLAVRQFSMADSLKNSLLSAEIFQVVVDSINVGKDLYNFNYVSVLKPYVKFELHEQGNNFSELLREEPATSNTLSSDTLSRSAAYGNIFGLMAAYVQELSQQYAIGNYKADSVVLRKGTLIFNDYTLQSKFNYKLEDLMVKADGFSSSDRAIKVVASSILNTSGRLKGEIALDPNGFRNMDIVYSITGLKVSDFNPYSNYYVAHPFLDGVCYYTSQTSVKNQYLKSTHKLEIRTIKVGKKEKNSTAYNLPLRLAVALLRDKNGNVNLELPIEGDLSDPKYKIGKIVWQVFKNLIGKAVASPGKLLASKSGTDEKLLSGFDWLPLQTALAPEQMNSLDALAKALESTPELNLELVEVYNTPREMDELGLKEGKKKFLFFHKKISSDETPTTEEEKIADQVHPKDSLYNVYLNEQLNSQGQLISVVDKSKKVVGEERLARKLRSIYEQRAQAVLQYMLEVKKLPVARFRVVPPKEKTEVPYEALSRMASNYYVDEQ